MLDPVRIEVHVHPGSATEGLRWDPWRSCWEVRCSAAAVGGAANDRTLALLAGWLDVPPRRLVLEAGARGRHKRVRVDGLGAEEVALRLRRAATVPDGASRAAARPTGAVATRKR